MSRILLIEDEVNVSAFIKRGLEEQSYQVDVAYDGVTGKSLALQKEYDVIILDIILPGSNGWEVLIFTTLTAFLILMLGLSVYYSSRSFTRRAFFDQLRRRTEIMVLVYLQKNDLTPELYRQVRVKLIRALPEEAEKIYNLRRQPVFVASQEAWDYPKGMFGRIVEAGYLDFDAGHKQAVGRLFTEDGQRYLVVVEAYDESGTRRMAELRNILLVSFLLGIGFVYVLGRFLSYHALKPIKSIVRQVNEISASNLNLRVPQGDGKDEISELSGTFNNMLDRLETSFELQRNFISNASHELRNPLTAILGEVEVTLHKSRPEGEYVQSLRKSRRKPNGYRRLRPAC
jgi:HAMP domain-containing protein